jgi:hypothetical protein
MIKNKGRERGRGKRGTRECSSVFPTWNAATIHDALSDPSQNFSCRIKKTPRKFLDGLV